MSPPGGGNKIQGPTQAQQILQGMLEGDKQKKLDTQQQTQQLREQARTQESMRQAVESKGQEEERGPGGEKTEGREGGAKVQTRERGEVKELVSKTEREMDGFLSRGSLQQKTREAGRELNRERMLNSHSPQSWTVSTSAQTSPKAREAILARQMQQPANPATTSRTAGAQPPQSPQPRVFTPTTLSSTVYRGLGRQEPQGPTIRYGRTAPQPSSESGRPTTPRHFLSQNLFQSLAQTAAKTATPGTPSGQGQAAAAPAVVHLRGPFLFVRDAQKLRAFKLEKDGSLSEIPTEDSSDEPLSPEARAAVRKILIQKGLLKGGEGKEAAVTGEISEAEAGEVLAEKKAEAGGKGDGALDFETKFALLLYEALEEHKKVEKRLGSGEDPHFPGKEDWEDFFANLAQLGNKEKSGKKSLEDILSLMFRGLFSKKGQGKFLVGDLSYSKSGKNRADKFAQVPVENSEFLNLLARLQPGEKITPENLKAFFGEELNYLLMAHHSEEVFHMASTAEKNVVFNPKSLIDPYSQARLENSIFSKRKKENQNRPAPETGLAPPLEEGPPQGVFANVYEWAGLRQRFEGSPKLYTFIAYLALASVLGIVLALTFLKVL